MKKIIVFILLLTMMFFIACGKESDTPESITPVVTEEATTEEPTTEESTTEESATEEEPTEKPTYPDDGKEMSVEDMYKGVINGTRGLYYGKRKKTNGIQECLDLFCNKGKISSFIYFDFDGDSVKDVALGTSYGFILYLTYKDGQVHGMVSSFRRIIKVYSNGVVYGSGSASTYTYSKMYFENGEVLYNDLCHGDLNPVKEEYFIEGNNVSKEEIDSYEEQLINGAFVLEWIPFTDENVEKYIVGEN